MSNLTVRRLVDDRSPIRTNFVQPDTTRACFLGFRIMRAILESEGMPRSDAEDWATVAVGAYRSAIARGRPEGEAFEHFFSEAQAAQYLEAHRGLT